MSEKSVNLSKGDAETVSSKNVVAARAAQDAVVWRPREAAFFEDTTTDIEMVASEGHVLFAQTTNATTASNFFVPLFTLALICGVSGGILTMNGMNASFVSDGPSSTAERLRAKIAPDYDSQTLLPDGKKVHAKFSWLNKLPEPKTGALKLADFRTLIDTYAAKQDPNFIAKSEQALKELEAFEATNGGWNTRAWQERLRMEMAKQLVKAPSTPVVPAKGFWNAAGNVEAMATTGVIAVGNDPSTYFAAAYIDGVPNVTLVQAPDVTSARKGECFTILGNAWKDSCLPVSDAPDGIRTLYEEAEPVVAPAAEPAEQKKWYLDFAHTSPKSISPESFSTIYESIRQHDNSPWDAKNWNAVADLPAQPLAVDGKGLWNDTRIVEAMGTSGVVASTSNPEKKILAAYLDGKPTVWIVTDGGCQVIFGDDNGTCNARDVEQSADIVKAMYEKTPASSQELKPYFWFADVAFDGESALNIDSYFELFNAASIDAQKFGTTKDGLARWENVQKLPNAIRIARPTDFFSKADNIAALGKGGVVIIPEAADRTLAIAAYVDGKLQLDIVEFRNNGIACSVVFGKQLIRECIYEDLGRNGDLVKSLFSRK